MYYHLATAPRTRAYMQTITTSDKTVLLFTRFPLPGLSKTRLIPYLGPKQAAQVQKMMTETIVATVSRLQKVYPHSFEIHYAGGSLEQMQSWLGTTHSYKKQPDEPLGTRLEHAIRPHLQENKNTVVIGADCPDITEKILQDALQTLSKHEVAIGPAHDGGYYLLGMTGSLPLSYIQHLFSDIAWGTNRVFTQTIRRIKDLNLDCHILQKLHDIDTPDDLRYINYYSDPQ